MQRITNTIAIARHVIQAHTRRWFVLALSFFIAIGPATLLVGHASATTPQAVVGMPFSGNWAWNVLISPPYTDSNSSYPSVHHTPGGGDWATDVYAAEGTAVKLSVPIVTGALSFSWRATSTTCGQSTGINILVDGTNIGWLYYAHLNNAVTSGAITDSMQLGTVHDWVVNGVHCNPGVHVHTEFKNTTNYSCYVDNGNAGVTLSYGTNLAVLGSSNTGAQQACSSLPSTPGSFPSSAVMDFNAKENVVARGINNEAYISAWQSGVGWSGFSSVQSGAVFAGNPTAIKFNSDGYIFARGTNNEIYKSISSGGSAWGGFTSLQSGATFASDPVAIQFDSSTLNVFAVGTDGQMYENTKLSSGWTGFSLLQAGSYFVGNPTVMRFNSKEYVVGRGINNEIYVNTWTSGVGWSGFTRIAPGYLFASDPVVFSFNSVLNIFARGTDNQLYVNYFDTSWHPFSLIQASAYFSGNPTVVAFGNKEQVFIRGTDNKMYGDAWQSGMGWGGFMALDTATMSGNPVAFPYSNVLTVFSLAPDTQMYSNYLDTAWHTFTVVQSGAVFNGFSWQ